MVKILKIVWENLILLYFYNKKKYQGQWIDDKEIIKHYFSYQKINICVALVTNLKLLVNICSEGFLF